MILKNEEIEKEEMVDGNVNLNDMGWDEVLGILEKMILKCKEIIEIKICNEDEGLCDEVIVIDINKEVKNERIGVVRIVIEIDEKRIESRDRGEYIDGLSERIKKKGEKILIKWEGWKEKIMKLEWEKEVIKLKMMWEKWEVFVIIGDKKLDEKKVIEKVEKKDGLNLIEDLVKIEDGKIMIM